LFLPEINFSYFSKFIQIISGFFFSISTEMTISSLRIISSLLHSLKNPNATIGIGIVNQVESFAFFEGGGLLDPAAIFFPKTVIGTTS